MHITSIMRHSYKQYFVKTISFEAVVRKIAALYFKQQTILPRVAVYPKLFGTCRINHVNVFLVSFKCGVLETRKREEELF